MPVTDKREPGVYVSIEDVSYSAPTLEVGRVVYSVILCDRGPHNRVVTVNSKPQFFDLFGKPNFRRVSQTHYMIEKALSYTGQVLVVRVVPADSKLSNAYIKENKTGTLVAETFKFTAGSNSVICDDAAAYDSFTIGQWIYGNTDTNDKAAQIISKEHNNTSGIYSLILDRKYEGTSADDSSAYKLIPYEIKSLANLDSESDLVNTDSDVVYYFYANGAGKWYNNLMIKGVRNTELEKYQIDDNGDPLYKYMFMDIGIYALQEDGTYTLLEGPWPVSLIPRYPNGKVVRDLTTSNFLYIEDVINSNSNIVKCVASSRDPITGEPKHEYDSITTLITSADGEDRRLQVMLLLSQANPTGLSNISAGGVAFQNGTDGTGLYDASGNYNPDDALMGLVAQAFDGSLTSVDGTIEQLPEVTYPWFEPDYIVCGGFPAAVQNSAVALSRYREDCITIGDTGGFKSKYEDDIKARTEDVTWNDWSAALYVQYRRIFDIYTGQKIWISPAYHAIERHLYCDGVYFIAEPVAGIEKGAISDPIKLAYKANHTERGNLIAKELNPVIVEPQGKYILTQFTTWKRLSSLKRLHVAKFLAYIRKTIPVLLKDLLQRRATKFWINQANLRVNAFLNRFLDGPVERFSILKSFSVNVEFDETYNDLRVHIGIVPIQAIETISVFIKVH